MLRLSRLHLALGASLMMASAADSVAANAATVGRYADEATATQKRDELRAQGRNVQLRSETVQWQGEAVILSFYQVREAAELAAERLRREGYPAVVLPNREAFGFTIQVDVYADTVQRDAAIAKLKARGFAQARSRSIASTLTLWLLEETGGKPPRERVARRETPIASPATRSLPTNTAPKREDHRTTPVEISAPANQATAASASASGDADKNAETFSFGNDDDVMAFGKQTNYESLVKQAQRRKVQQAKGFSLEDFRLETGYFTETPQQLSSLHSLALRLGYDWQGEHMEARIGARLDAVAQSERPRQRDSEVDYDETWLRWRAGTHKWTVGAQRIVWGGLDELAPGNAIASQDLTRFVLDDLSNRYRAMPALRYEAFFGRTKLDVVALPVFRPAELPAKNSVWFPIDQENGRMLGFPDDPVLAGLIRSATINTRVRSENGGGGVRLTRQGDGLDWGVSVQHVRHSTPYFRISPRVLAGQSSELILERWHPFTDLASVDLSFSLGESTLRAEAAWSSDVPVTDWQLRTLTAPALSAGLSYEFFPGGGNTRLSLQVGTQKIDPDQPVLDRLRTSTFSGELETFFAAETWRMRVRFMHSRGEGMQDHYLNPEIAYIRNEPDEFYLGGHWFDGDEGSAGAYHADHDLLVLGWRSQF